MLRTSSAPTLAEDAIFCKILARLGVGPFDGGCLIVAEALKKALGGTSLCALADKNGTVHHAIVQLEEGRYLDADGIHSRQELVDLWQTRENIHITDIYLMETREFLNQGCGVYDGSTIKKLTEYLKGMLCQAQDIDPRHHRKGVCCEGAER